MFFSRDHGERNNDTTSKSAGEAGTITSAARTTAPTIPSFQKEEHPTYDDTDSSQQQLVVVENNEIKDDDDDEDMMMIRRPSEERELRRPYEVQTPTKYRTPLLLQPRQHYHPATTGIISKSHSSTGIQPTTTTTTATTANPLSRTQSQPSPLPSGIFGIGIPPVVSTTTSTTAPQQQHYNNNNNSTTNRIPVVETSPVTTTPPDTTWSTTATSSSLLTRPHITSIPPDPIQLPSTTKRHEQRTTTTDLPSVQIRYVNVTQRSAFGHYSLTPMIRQLEAQLPQQQQHRISPSWNQAQALHRMYNTHVIRQIQFSPSTSIDADYHYQIQPPPQNKEHAKDGSSSGRNSKIPSLKRDGRYRCIDPTKINNIFRHIESSSQDNETFPTPPQFSYRKHRLPNRADVGFGRCTEEEIQMKQNEIRNETLWEMVRVRTTCVISCIDLIRMAHPTVCQNEEEELDHLIITQSMPYAGRHLRAAMMRKWVVDSNPPPSTQPSTTTTTRALPPYQSVLPDPYSILAPPIESTYSASQGWRPRIYHDRPTGLRYCYVNPMNVTLWEPSPNSSHDKHHGDQNSRKMTTNHTASRMIGSLALYTLPPLSKRLLNGSSSSTGRGSVTAATAAAYHCQKTKSIPAYGKISEEFYFPIHTSNVPRNSDVTSNKSNIDRKAIFSYNPLDLLMESIHSKSSSGAGPDSLYIVVRVYEVIPFSESDESTTTNKPPMKHLAFGITKVFSKTTMLWPDGLVKALQLYSYPVDAESQGSFVERLWRTVHQKSFATPSNDGSESTSTRHDDTSSIGISVDDTTAPNKRSLGERLLRSPPLQLIMHSRSQSVNSIDISSMKNQQPLTTAICGTAQLFISSLSIDFLQCMIPSQPNTAATITSQSSHQLTDATGDFAVTTEINHSEGDDDPTEGGNISKRSNLIRLPQHADRGGYSGSAGCHEILYLPARPDRHYPIDNHMAISRCILNLLYIYPRLIRSSPRRQGTVTKSGLQFTIRIQVLHSDGAGTDKVKSPVACFYDRASWDGAGLVSSFYTNIVETTRPDDEEHGMSIQDEIRIRLPDVLDGNYKVEFTLHSLKTVDGAVQTLTSGILATSSIPLASTRSDDATSNIRVVTIVPNGKHRLELGDYQFHFETRVLSSIHHSDPIVAASTFDCSTGNSHTRDTSEVLSFSSVELQLSKNVMSVSAVIAFFQVLLYMNLHHIVKAINGTLSDPADYLRMLYVVLTTVKSYFLSKPGLPNTDDHSYKHFVKSCVDLFDESCLFESASSTPTYEIVDDDAVEVNDPHIVESHGVDDDGFEVDFATKESDWSNSTRGKQERYSWRRWKSQLETNLSIDGVPFSRVPFDTSKIIPLKPENESKSWRGHVAVLYDDDETIATAPSIFSARRSVDTQTIMSVPTAQEALLSGESAASFHSFDDNSIVRHKALSSHRPAEDTEFVKRVKNAASLIIAPCVAPSLTSVLKSPRDFSGTMNSRFQHDSKDMDSNVFTRTATCLCLPGSDIDEENASKEWSTNRRYDVKAIKSMREYLDNGNVSYNILTNVFEKESVDVCQTLYEVLIKGILLTYNGQDEFPNQRVNRATQTSSKTLKDSSDFQLRSSMAHHIELIVPLCLRSIIVRHGNPDSRLSAKVFIEKSAFDLIEVFTRHLAGCLIFLCNESTAEINQRENSLHNALQSSQIVLDFLVGLSSIIQAKQVEVLVSLYFLAMRDHETISLQKFMQKNEKSGINLNEEICHQLKCSQQLRLLAAEKLFIIPSFLALNVPVKYTATNKPEMHKETTAWLTQYVGRIQESLPGFERNTETVHSGWLADLVLTECLKVCSAACHLVVKESEELVEASLPNHKEKNKSAFRMYPKSTLGKLDLESFHCTALHAIGIVYELVVRRHSMDQRFQSESAQGRIAGLIAKTVLKQTCENVQWLAKLDCTNQVRSTWLLCFTYVLQEAPENLVYDFIRSCFNKNNHVAEFIESLSLCSVTFQHFGNLECLQNVALVQQQMMLPWLIQENFNTICAAVIVIVDVSVESFCHSLTERSNAIEAVIGLLLQTLTLPQSPVTQLRAIGAVLLVLERDVKLFLDLVDADIEHWIRIMLSLMNSQTLCVRSIAVDFVVSLISGIFTLQGNVDSTTLMFGSILPEVIAREIGLYCVSGHIGTMEDVAMSVWPIRRAIADIGDSNPLDDDRIDPILATILSTFSRACQAIIDGVFIELRLRGDSLYIVGVKVEIEPRSKAAFDADEESLFEAASFFRPEMAPIQKIRWLLSLKTLHLSRNQWIEASECLLLCATTICFSLPFLNDTWWPSRYELWSNGGPFSFGFEAHGHVVCGNMEIMALAEDFLEPNGICATQRPSIKMMCELLVRYTSDAIELSKKQSGFEAIYHGRLQSLVEALNDSVAALQNQPLTPKVSARMMKAEGEAAVYAVSKFLRTKTREMDARVRGNSSLVNRFVAMRIHGKKPNRFEESTTIPTFLEWEKWCVCRISMNDIDSESIAVKSFVKPFVETLRDDNVHVMLRTNADDLATFVDPNVTYIDVVQVKIVENGNSSLSLKHFVYQTSSISEDAFYDIVVANDFPCPISRQRALEMEGSESSQNA